MIPAVTGELTVAFTLTEPTAGTGADIRCEVEREGDTYYLSGEKHLITFGVSCDRWLLFARLAGTKGAEGTVALLVDRETPGVTVEDMGDSLGVRGTDHAHLVFDRAPVPVADRLGEEGEGLEVAFGGFLTPSRIAVAMSCVGLARRAQELAVEHAVEARHLRQAALPAAGDPVRPGRERRRHRSRAAARPARGAALGGGRRPRRRCSPRWRS